MKMPGTTNTMTAAQVLNALGLQGGNVAAASTILSGNQLTAPP